MKFLKYALAAASLFATLSVQANPVTYKFAGSLETSPFSQLAVGSGFSGSFTYDNASPDSVSGSGIGSYALGFSINATVGGFTYSSQTGNGQVVIWDNQGRDRFNAFTQGSFGYPSGIDSSSTIPGYQIFGLRADFDDTTNSVFSSDALPGSTLDLSKFDATVFQLSFYDQSGNGSYAVGRITSLETPSVTASVPEPESFALFGIGLAALCLFRRKERLSV